MTTKRFLATTLLGLALSTARATTICSGNSAPAVIDIASGTRTAALTETIRYSTTWETSAAGATAVVAINGETVNTAAGSGACVWQPTKNGTYTLTHKVVDGGTQVGETLTATFLFDQCPATPVFSPEGGVVGGWPASISIACATEGAVIHYTTDGTEPTAESPVYQRFRISERTTVKAVAVKDGLLSEVAVAEYALGKCANPVIHPANGTTFEHSGQPVSISWSGADGVLRYTTDGSDPTATSPVYDGPFTIDETTTIKAKAFAVDDQILDSAVVTANLTRVWLNVATPAIAAAPTFTGAKTRVAISCATAGATIRYTLDGSAPDSQSPPYTEPFYVTDSCTVKAYATCADFLDSAVASFAIEKVWGIGDTMGTPNHAYTTGGSVPFSRVTDATAPLGEAMRSGAISDGQTSTMTTTVTGNETVSFLWRTSCEQDPDGWYEWDHAEFEVDGVVVGRLDGVTAWQTFSHRIEGDGSHTLVWRYVKDAAESAGDDCCLVADFHRTVTVTADAKGKTYGDADPALTAVVTGLDAMDEIEYTLTRTEGEGAGTYAITPSGAATQGNYTVVYESASLTVSPKSLTVTADAKSKVYGDADPALTYTVSGLVGADALSGALTRVGGENVGTYAIAQGTLDAGANYTIAYTGANLAVSPKTLTVVADAKSKVYGDADPALTYTASGLVGDDVLSGALSRVEGENVGTYAIAQGTLDAGANYMIAYTGANVAITAASATVRADPKGKTYGDADPTLTATVTGLVGMDTVAYTLARADGENVGTYAITPSGATTQGNYTVVYETAPLTVSPKALTVTADAKSKVYGDADPALTYTVSGLVGADALSGALTRAEGENVGAYAIAQGTLDAGANYTIAYTGADLTITAATVIVTADAKSKVYGDADPELTATVTGLVGTDTVTYTLARIEGEDAGTYTITPSGAATQGNYVVVYETANLTISPKTLTIVADAKSKVYGSADPELTYTASGLIGSDTLSGGLTRMAGENVGTYVIVQGTLDAGANYTLMYTRANLTVSPKALTVTADAKSKVYGETDPALTYMVEGLVGTDTLSGTLTRAVGESVGMYAIAQGTLDAGNNYTIAYTGANLTVSPKTLIVTADAKNKVYGDADPELTYTVEGLVGADTLSGALTRTVGENVGTYAIAQGTLDAGANYTITYTGANLAITAATVTVTADAKGKTYGDADPKLTATVTGLVGTDTVSYTLARAEGENVGTYTITPSGAATQENYVVVYETAKLTISPKTLTVVADAKNKVYGDADPELTYTVEGLVGGDTLSGALTRAEGENVGTYAIAQGTLDAGANYTLTYTGADLTITAATVTVAADAKGKVYGEADPELTATITGLVGTDTVAYTLARAEGENVGTYTITPSGAATQGNYTVVYKTANLTVSPKALTVVADAKSKVYGDADPELTYTVQGLVGEDTLSGALTRAEGENVGTYAIEQGTLDAGANYTITYTGAYLIITAPEAPVISPADGVVADWPVTVTISCATEGATIHHTTDGTEPTANSPTSRRFRISGRTTVKAVAIKDGLASEIAVAEYASGVCSNPVVTAASTFTGSKTSVALSCPLDGAVIRYTLDGSSPDAGSAVYSEPFFVTNSCTVKAYATYPDYFDSEVVSFAIEKVWGIGDTMGDPDQSFSTGGDVPFFRVTDATAPLGEAMQSGAITHEQSSTMTTTVDGPGTISFQWKTSCEDSAGVYDWDHAEFEVDGNVVEYLDGETSWQTVSHVISDDGPHTLVWRYVKDDVESEGEDCCRVADFRWTPVATPAYTETQTTPEPVPYAWLRGFYPEISDEYEAYESAAFATAANGRPVWECYVAGLDPTDPDDDLVADIAIVDGEPRISVGGKGEREGRVYTVEGKPDLSAEWGPTNNLSRFFRVKAGLAE